LPVGQPIGEGPVPGGQVLDPLARSGVFSPVVIVSSARWALAAGPGSADRNGAKYWPG